jgi:N-acyl-D-amino-acid deacylase
MPDILIRGGQVIDGTGRTWFRADVGIDGDALTVLRGDTSALEAGKVIDATGLAVCPGFIDMHSHSDMALLTNPRHEAKVSQGVTTEALGQDGLSYAPISPPNLEPLLQYLAAVNGRPPDDVRWSSVREFLDLFDDRVSCNVVYCVAHAAVRIEAMGWDARLPTEGELGRMQELVAEGMRDGAFGFSTGLTYVPGAYSDTHEIVEVARAIRPYGGIYVTHSRYALGDGLLDPFREAISVGKEGGIPVQISHYHNPLDGMGERMLALVDAGRDDGVDVTFDQYPYPAASTVLLSLIPFWVHAGGPHMLLERIKSRQVRDQIKDDIFPQWGGGLENYMFSQIGSDKNKEWEGRSLVDMSRALGKSMVDTVCDILIEENLNVAFVARTGNPDNIRTIFKHPAQMVGSDGLLTGDKPNPRSYGTFPFILGQLVREKGLLRLEDAVQKMTSVPAQRLGLKDRGILRDGMKADIVVFNPRTVRATATFEEPRQLPVGIDYVFVNGRLVMEKGEHTGALPGRALRHA